MAIVLQDGTLFSINSKELIERAQRDCEWYGSHSIVFAVTKERFGVSYICDYFYPERNKIFYEPTEEDMTYYRASNILNPGENIRRCTLLGLLTYLELQHSTE